MRVYNISFGFLIFKKCREKKKAVEKHNPAIDSEQRGRFGPDYP